IQPLFAECAAFICPIRSGSGVRVKLLEAFASGIPVVSTTLGAEGLARKDGEFCVLADNPRAFAEGVIRVLEDPAYATELAARARREVETNWDMAVITARLADRYKALIAAKRAASEAGEPAASSDAPALQSHLQ
ncbi:MAG TPA: glycosyltransferase, partial [Bryobacteraceae bacterium]|nr:glycosyltransferase [Bryobacteraceae bacterium]